MSRRFRSVVLELGRTLGAVDDPRAEAVMRALPTRPGWDPAALEAALGAPDPRGDALRALAQLQRPDLEVARIATDALLAAALEVEDTRHATELDERAADIVRAALAWHEIHGAQPCPLCGTGQLGPGWRRWAELWLAEREGSNVRGASARQELARAEDEVRRLIRPPALVAGSGVDTSAVEGAIARLEAATPLRERRLATAVAERLAELADVIAAVAAEATRSLALREELWAPIAAELGWVVEEARSSSAVRTPIATPGAPREVRRLRRSPRRTGLESGPA